MASFLALNSRHFRFPVSQRFLHSPPLHLTRIPKNPSFSPPRPLTWSGCSHVTNPRPPSPPEPGNETTPIQGVEVVLYQIWDGTRIFFAVLFWMSLFFWYSAWDGQDKGRPNKRSRFR